MYKRFFKRIIDVTLSLIGLFILSPVFLLLTILLLFANRGTPFFVQARPGKGGRVFKMFKFKTMNDRRDGNGDLLPDHERLTKLGACLRKSSLDEMPQLLNVIKGEMSLIGPRPLLVEYLPLYSKSQARRHEVRSGITGWAQVNGRNTITWAQKFEYDVWYVDHISFLLDMKIVGLTILKVFTSEGVNASEQITMEAFNGNN